MFLRIIPCLESTLACLYAVRGTMMIIIIIQKICSVHIATLLGAQGVNPETQISVLGSFTCITQHTGLTALRPIRRTKQLWLSVLLKDTSAATFNVTLTSAMSNLRSGYMAQSSLISVSWSAMVERFSTSDLCSDGRVIRMWVRILAGTMVLVSFNKTVYHNCFSPPRSTWVPVRWLVCLISPTCTEMAAIELYTPQGAEMVSGMIYAPDEQRVIMYSTLILLLGYVHFIRIGIIII